jgi:hypothetical protein
MRSTLKETVAKEVQAALATMKAPTPKEQSYMDTILHQIQDMNMNPYLLGIAYITLNLGSRFFVMSVSPGQEAFLQNMLFRPILLFAIMFIGTRNLIVAFWMTLLILLCLHFLLNENSSWFVLRDWSTTTHSGLW